MRDEDIKMAAALKTLAADMKKNTQALLKNMVGQDVVLRSEWEARNEVLNQMSAQLDELEARVAALEKAKK